MTTGCVIFAFDGDIAYGPQAVLAACLVKKHLGIPTTLITDVDTLDKIDPSVFDKCIITKVDTDNQRILNGKSIAFKNTNRNSVYNLTPYDRTLVIDSDFLVFSDRLKPFLESKADFMICPSMNNDAKLLHPATIPMLWATNIIFNKTPEVKILFDLIDHIKENWLFYGSLYKFDTRRFRNDYAFSVACFTLDNPQINLPSPAFFSDNDKIIKISDAGITILTEEDKLVKVSGQDVHLMNKQDILDNLAELMELSRD